MKRKYEIWPRATAKQVAAKHKKHENLLLRLGGKKTDDFVGKVPIKSKMQMISRVKYCD